MQKIDLLGQRFGKLTVVGIGPIKQFPSGQKKTNWECRCDCNRVVFVTTGHLRTAHTSSCGCHVKTLHTKHGMSGTKFYTVWENIIQRITNPKHSSFKDYGGRGIALDPNWRFFDGFYKDMYPTYAEGLEIERKDNDKGYCKDNCRWATRKEQMLNTRRNRFVVFRGKTMTYSQLAEKSGLPKHIVKNRLKRGWSVSRTLCQPVSIWKGKRK